MNWTSEDPGIGSPAEIRGYATSRGATATSLRTDAAAQLSAALANTAGWSAVTADVVRSVVTRIQPEPSLIADQLEAEARALSSYAAEVERIQTRVRSIQTRREDLESRRWAADLEMNQYSARFDVVTGAEAADQARLERRISILTDQLADLDAELRALVTDRENADTACVNALAGTGVLGSLASFTGGGTSTGLLAKLTQLTATDLLILAQTQPGVFEQLRTAPPTVTDVADWWANLDSTAQAALIAAVPAVIGSMNGVPALSRVAANQVNAIALIAASEAELARLTGENPDKSFWDWYLASQTGGYDAALDETAQNAKLDRIEMLKKEIEYLEQVIREKDPIQLYLYDRDNSRIIEMIGTPSATTSKVVTYVPGTFTSLFDFYKGGVQQIAADLFDDNQSGVVAFIYKDGIFPGENRETGAMDLTRIFEANDKEFARQSGTTLAAFEDGMRSDPLLGNREQIAIAHSWGLADVTSSEVAGARYDKVISLSGAGMLPDWEPNSGTQYTDLSYRDLLQTAQHMGLVWDGNNPRESTAFDHGPYYQGPSDEVLNQAARDPNAGNVENTLRALRTTNPELYAVLMDNHNLVAADRPDNQLVLDDIRDLVNR